MTIKLSLLPLIAVLILPVPGLSADEKSDNPVLARVNGVAISVDEVRHFIQSQEGQLAPDRALQEMINVELVVQAARNEGLMNDDILQLEIKRNTSGLIASHYLQTFLSRLEISEEDLKARYQKDYVQGSQELEYNANHILLETETEARDVIKQLDQGAVFSELAKTLSTGPSGKNGGALGWFKSGDMVAPFSEAATQLKAGEYSKQPVQTQFGWHVILLNETRQQPIPEFESVRQKLSTAIAADSISAKIRALQEAAKIDFNPEP